MAIQERVYDIDDLWEIVCQPENADKHFELINGELFEMAPPGEEHGYLAGEIFHLFRLFDPQRELGIPTVETGYYPLNDRSTVLSPDVAFRRTNRTVMPLNKRWVPTMPNLAVEIVSPSNTMPQIRRKAALYLQHGAQLVWIVIPDRKGAEVCRLDASGKIQSESINADGSLSGEQVLPGFELKLSNLFK
ncbi:MAG: Uma2 family endonuclease [Chloroflexi bacterium]|nr:Uma2 family endonuclease [Chloroflexota bacterium]